MKTHVIILIGPPCSGKSTWAKNQLKLNNTYIRINRDDIRTMLNGQYIFKPELEKYITKITDNMIISASNAGKNIIIDNTHCKAKYIADIIENHKEYSFTLKFFIQPLWKLKLRNKLRYLRTGVYIPNKVITDMYNNYMDLVEHLHKYLNMQIPNIQKIER